MEKIEIIKKFENQMTQVLEKIDTLNSQIAEYEYIDEYGNLSYAGAENLVERRNWYIYSLGQKLYDTYLLKESEEQRNAII